MVLDRFHIKLVIVIAFFISIIPFGYKVYEHKDGLEILDGAASVTPRLLGTQSEEAWRAAALSEVFESDIMFRLCDQGLSVYRPIGSGFGSELVTMEVDLRIGSTIVDVTCKRSLPYTMLTYIFYFLVPFAFMTIFGLVLSWVIGSRKKVKS